MIADITAGEDDGALVEQMKRATIGGGDQEVRSADGIEGEGGINGIEEPIDAGPGLGADGYDAEFGLGVLEDAAGLGDLVLGIFDEIGLVHDEDLVGGSGVDFLEDLLNVFDIGGSMRIGDIDDVQEKSGVGDFLERGAEGLDQGSGKLTDEADGIAQQDLATAGENDVADGGIESGEHLRISQDASLGEAIEQGAFARVGITDEGDGGEGNGLALFALDTASGADFIEIRFNGLDAAGDLAPIGLELCFAGTAGADPSAQAGHSNAAAGEAGHKVVELSQFHLELAFAGAGARGKDIEDELGAVEDLNAKGAFEIALLGGSELGVEENGIGAETSDQAFDFAQLARPYQGSLIGFITALENRGGDHRTGAFGESTKFSQGFGRRQIVDGGECLFGPPQFYTDENSDLGQSVPVGLHGDGW